MDVASTEKLKLYFGAHMLLAMRKVVMLMVAMVNFTMLMKASTDFFEMCQCFFRYFILKAFFAAIKVPILEVRNFG